MPQITPKNEKIKELNREQLRQPVMKLVSLSPDRYEEMSIEQAIFDYSYYLFKLREQDIDPKMFSEWLLTEI